MVKYFCNGCKTSHEAWQFTPGMVGREQKYCRKWLRQQKEARRSKVRPKSERGSGWRKHKLKLRNTH